MDAGVRVGASAGGESAKANGALQQRVRELIAEYLGLDFGDLREDASIIEDLGADSLDVVELVMAIEESFGIEISDEDANSMRTLGDVERYVAARVAA